MVLGFVTKSLLKKSHNQISQASEFVDHAALAAFPKGMVLGGSRSREELIIDIFT